MTALTNDNADRLTQITYGSFSASLTYDNSDRRTLLTYPNGVMAQYTYDAASTLTGISYSYGTNTLGALTYSLDPPSRTLTASGSYAKITLPQPVTSATYDAGNELTQWGATPRSYDANGNLISDPTRTLTWDARNQLVSVAAPDCLSRITLVPTPIFMMICNWRCYAFDANGNTLSDAQGRGFTWDFENRLVQATNPGVGNHDLPLRSVRTPHPEVRTTRNHELSL